MTIKLAVPIIQSDSIVDGEGIRSVIWTQGCPHKCPGCHNPQTHNTNEGIELDIEEIKSQIDALTGQDGITFSGGDPMIQPKACAEIAKYCHSKGLNVWCYTGFTYEELIKLSQVNSTILEFLKQVDVLVDGKFLLSEKSYDVVFRGSKNQRLIDVKKTLKAGNIKLITKYDEYQENRMGRKSQYVFV